MKTLMVALAAAVLVGAGAAEAGMYHQPQYWPGHRVERGRCHGNLTRAELRILRAEERNLERARRRAFDDGVVTRQEARFLDRAYSRAARQMDRLQHNQRKWGC